MHRRPYLKIHKSVPMRLRRLDGAISEIVVLVTVWFLADVPQDRSNLQ